jgi:hypothetical protein
MNRFVIKSCLIVLLGWAAISSAFATDIVFPPIQAFAHFPYMDDVLAGPRRFRFGFSFAADNTLEYCGEYPARFDFESLSAGFSVRYGLTRKINLEFYIKGSHIWGGLFDRAIETFHFAFGFPNGFRGEVDENRVEYRYHDLYDYRSARSVLLPPVIAILSEIFADDRWTVKTRLALGIPVHPLPGLSSDRPFAAAGCILAYETGRLRIAWAHYLAAMKKPSWLRGEKAASTIYFSDLKVSYRSLFAALTFRTSPLRDRYVGQDGLQLLAGLKFRSGLEIGFVEGLPPMETTSDIGLYVQYGFR